jgi:hypothetical protein
MMEAGMRARLLMVATIGLFAAGAVAAEPAKAPVRKADQPAEQPVPVVVAAADQARAPATAEQVPAAPVKRERRARVTTCRCGDQAAGN